MQLLELMFAAIICVKIKTVLLVAAWFLLFPLPSPRCLGSLGHSCKREVFVSTPSSALPVKCLGHRGASQVPLASSHWFSFAVLAHTWLFSIGVVDLELLCSAGASVLHGHICCDVDGVLLLLIYEAIHASFLSLDWDFAKVKMKHRWEYQCFVCLLSFSSQWVKVMLVLMSSRAEFSKCRELSVSWGLSSLFFLMPAEMPKLTLDMILILNAGAAVWTLCLCVCTSSCSLPQTMLGFAGPL